MRALRLLPWVGGVVVGVAAEAALYDRGYPGDWAPDLLAGWSLIACGLVASSRRPESRSGALMAATGFAWFAGNFSSSEIGWIAWLSAHALFLYRGPLVHLVLTYPRGRCTSKLETGAVGLGYAFAVITPVWSSLPVTIALSGALVAVSTRDYLRAAGPERRERLAAWQATAFTALVLAGSAAARLADPGADTAQTTLHVQQISLSVLAIALLVGLLAQPWRRTGVADIVLELGDEYSRNPPAALARAIGDPTLVVGYWSPETGGYVDDTGRPLELPDSDSGRGVTYVDHGGLPAAVLEHDPAVLEDPVLLEAVATASQLAGAHARLRAEVRRQLTELEASRLRLLRAEDSEHRRLEHRVRDTVERRLRRIGVLLERASGAEPPGEPVAAIEGAAGQVEQTLGELQELARGLHPFGGRGESLVEALRVLAEQCPVPVELSLTENCLPDEAGATIYFICSEALANVAKYASASRARLSLLVGNGSATVEISDDGVGGADLHRGTGLRGLADRVDALGGSLHVESLVGQGTRVTAEVPLQPTL